MIIAFTFAVLHSMFTEIIITHVSCTIKEIKKKKKKNRRHIEIFFSDLLQKTGFDISCKLSPETVCMKCLILFSEKKSSNCCRLYKPINANHC